MSVQGRITIGFNAAGVAANKTITKTEGNASGWSETLPAGSAGTLSTRTNDTDGTVTLTGSHGITDADVIDIHWVDAAGLNQVAYGATVGTVAAQDVPFTGASGTALPAEDYVIVADEQIEILTPIDGDNLEMIGVSPEFAQSSNTSGVRVDFQDSGDATIKALTMYANGPFTWDPHSNITNPFTGNPITHCHVSNGVAAACTLIMASLVDPTP